MNQFISITCMLLFLMSSSLAHAQDSNKQSLFTLPNPLPAPDFVLQGEDGKTYRLSDYRGQVVVLNFWTTWCPPCRFEMPSMERVWQKVKGKGVVILAVNMGEDEETIFEFTGSYPVTFPLPMDTDGKVIEAYPVIGLPTTYIISPDGMITHRAVGTREWEHPQILEQLLKMRRQPKNKATFRQ